MESRDLKRLSLQENISESIEYAKGLFTDFGRLIILIVLNLIPIVNFIVVGYYAKCIKESPESTSPPKLTDFGSLWVQGLKIIVVIVVYMIIPGIFLGLTVASFIFTMRHFPIVPPHVMYSGFYWSFFGVLALIGVVLAFLSSLLMAMGIVNMVKKDSLSKAFAIRSILRIIGNVGWGYYIVWAIVIFILSIIVGLFGAIPYIGWIISLVVSPAFGVFTARSATLVYLKGAEEVQVPSSVPTPAPADVKFCIYCGARIPADAEYCPKCGRKQ